VARRSPWHVAIVLTLAAVCPAAPRYHSEQRDGLVVLRDDQAGVEATISPKHGGELCGLKYRVDGAWVELLYRACDYSKAAGWRGKAPLLWPATGATAGKYRAGGKEYEMPFHGFVQGMPWKVDVTKADSREARALLSLGDTEETRKSYPFSWRLTVEYRLQEGRLHLFYKAGSSVENRGTMFFSIGNHITFRTPFLPGSDGGKVTMETPGTVLLKKNAQNLPTGETQPSPYQGRVELSKVEPGRAQSLGGYKGDPTLVLMDPKGLRVRMKHSASRLPSQPLVQFNLWGDAKAGYFSPEPWVGGQNSFHTKMGLVELKPGELWEWTIEIYPMMTAKM
jgi:galactose mutarotase-like enzyme